ncbi:MAG: site-specific integrase [Myxococcota bacterium]|nr:site-specific integrase [Myxococcota bacterium]
MSLEIGELPGGFNRSLAADFSLDEAEVVKGQHAATGYLETLQGDERNCALEALETLTLVFSTGVCEGVDFPWHQVRAHHRQAALSMLKEEGAPSKLETLRCQLDPHHKFRQDPAKFTPKKIQRFKTTLQRVLKESHELGYLSRDEWDRVKSPNKAVAPSGDRIVSHGEFRALLVACGAEDNAESLRDRLIFYLLYHGGLMLAELIAVNVDDLHFDHKCQQVTVKTGKAKNQKSRRVALPNEALISLEDWLELRGNAPGSLLNPIKKGQRIDVKRMAGADVRAACEKRAKEIGVLNFSPDELRKSPAAQIEMAKAANRARRRARTVEPELATVESDDPLYADAAIADSQRKLATVCFPVWELSIKS